MVRGWFKGHTSRRMLLLAAGFVFSSSRLMMPSRQMMVGVFHNKPIPKDNNHRTTFQVLDVAESQPKLKCNVVDILLSRRGAVRAFHL